jgi:membrane-anchored protein YejM (alkaline phosphatase superfamily)
MTFQSAGRSLRTWWSARAGAYARAILALGLNIPFLLLLATRYLRGTDPTSIAGMYAALVVLGYYVLALQIVISIVFLLTGFSTRLALVISSTLLATALGYLAIDGVVYRLYRFHIDAFWIQYLVGQFSGFGASPLMVAVTIGIIAAVVLLEWWILKVAKRIRTPLRWATAVGVLALVAFGASQAIHVLAYDRNDGRITQITPRLPFYFPIVSHRDAVKYSHVLPSVSETDHLEDGNARSFMYPLHPVHWKVPAGARRPNIVLLLLESWRYDTMNERVSPNMYRLAQRSSVFANHFSSGNSTPSGVFGLFYGIHPTYWTAVKANSATIDNPVLIDVLGENDYAFGIFADSHFERHKIKDAMFHDIEVKETFAGKNADTKDADMTNQLIRFMSDEHAAGRPFFGFAFYKSTHFNYFYPRDDAPFKPARKLDLGLTGSSRSAENRDAFFNDYLNAVHYTDEMVGRVVAALDSMGALDNTIIVVTSDHGEEFDDNHADYWGHTGNFTGYQTRVPMFIYVPWKEPRTVKETTAHIDLPVTLLEEGLGCDAPERDYTNGHDMLGKLPPDRPIVITSYVNHAIISGDNVYVVYPMYVQKYKLWDIKADAPAIQPAVARQAMDEMSRFYREESTAAR